MIMKASPSSILRALRTHKHAALVVEAATSEPQVPALAQAPRYLTVFTAIDRASHLGLASNLRVRAMDAMVRLSEGDADGRAQLVSILTESEGVEDVALRDMIMTLATMENAHRANLVSA